MSGEGRSGVLFGAKLLLQGSRGLFVGWPKSMEVLHVHNVGGGIKTPSSLHSLQSVPIVIVSMAIKLSSSVEFFSLWEWLLAFSINCLNWIIARFNQKSYT